MDSIGKFRPGNSGYVSTDYSQGARTVLSGVPQSHTPVLGPSLFLIFINDLDLNISSSVFKSADDTKITSTINNWLDSKKLQADLDTLYQWAVSWQMNFNVFKCKVMHLISRRNAGFRYSVNSQLLEEVTSYRDLGIIMSSHFKVTELNSVKKHITKPIGC